MSFDYDYDVEYSSDEGGDGPGSDTEAGTAASGGARPAAAAATAAAAAAGGGGAAGGGAAPADDADPALPPASFAPVLGRQVSYDAVDLGTVRIRKAELLRDLVEVLHVPEHAAYTLLVHTGCDKSRTESRFFENRDKFLEEAHVTLGPDPPARPEEWAGEDAVFCEVCYGEVSPDDMDAPPCGHFVCKECWRGVFSAASADRSELMSIACATCGQPVTERMYREYLPDDAFERYQRFELARFIAEDESTRECPFPECGMIVRYPRGLARDVVCPGGTPAEPHIFCFACGRPGGHAPAGCDDMVEWDRAVDKDKLDAQWIVQNTRPCPRCGAPIEKNQGCSMMICGRHYHGGKVVAGVGGCGLLFCWNCMQPWNKGNHGACKAWVPKDSKRMGDEEFRSFVDTISAYDLNQKAAAAAHALLPGIAEATATLLSDWEMPLDRLEHLERAALEVAESRRVIANACIWQYFWTEAAGTKAALFALNLESLKTFSEKLQQLLEGPSGRPSVAMQLLAAVPVGPDAPGLRAAFGEDRDTILQILDTCISARESVVKDVQETTAALAARGAKRSRGSGMPAPEPKEPTPTAPPPFRITRRGERHVRRAVRRGGAARR